MAVKTVTVTTKVDENRVELVPHIKTIAVNEMNCFSVSIRATSRIICHNDRIEIDASASILTVREIAIEINIRTFVSMLIGCIAREVCPLLCRSHALFARRSVDGGFAIRIQLFARAEHIGFVGEINFCCFSWFCV